MSTTGCTVEAFEVPRKMDAVSSAPSTFWMLPALSLRHSIQINQIDLGLYLRSYFKRKSVRLQMTAEQQLHTRLERVILWKLLAE